MTQSLRTRMLTLALAPATVVAILLGGTFVLYSIDNMVQELHTRGTAISRQISAAAEYGLFSGQRESLSELAKAALRTDPDARGAAILDSQGAIIASSGDLHPTHWPGLAQVQGFRMEPDVLLFVEPVVSSSLPVGDIYAGEDAARTAEPKVLGHVVIELSRGRISGKTKTLLVVAILSGLFAVALGAWLALRISRQVIRPLLEANAVVARIGKGDLEARMQLESVGTLRSLAVGINDMAGRIGVTQEDLRLRIAAATLDLQREKEAAEYATIAKSRFLAAASHDLRQPMQAISLFSDALIRSGLSEEQKPIGEYLSRSIGSLGDLLNALLDITKLDVGAVKACVERIEAEDVAQKINDEFSPLAAAKSLRFKIYYPFGEMAIMTDGKLLLRLLDNLVGNALKYTRHGGILVAIRRCRDQALVQVWDTGTGIAPEHLNTIYEEYFQIGNPERDKTKGLGLGLAIAKRLARALGTEIVCRSKLGRGSVFEFRLPLADPVTTDDSRQADRPRADARGTSSLAGRRIVVVENDVMVATAIEMALELLGATVTCHRNAEDALADPRSADADFHISDFRLRGMNGIEFLNAVQKRSAQPVKAVLLTGDVAPDRIAITESCPWTVLFKPVDLRRLISAIELQVAMPASANRSA